MSRISESERSEFFEAVEAATKTAIWCAVATAGPDGPRVRMVHPTWEGETLWFATGSGTLKTVQIAADPRIDVQFQVAPPDFRGCQNFPDRIQVVADIQRSANHAVGGAVDVDRPLLSPQFLQRIG